MTDHSNIVGGSSAGRVIACPPSRLSAQGVIQEETQYMRDGTTLHNAMETHLTTGDPIVMVDESLQPKFDEAARIWQLLASDVTVTRVHVEQRVHIAPIPGAFGTADVIMEHSTNMITVLDWKFGDGVQVRPDAPQMMFYGAAAMTDPAFKHLFDADTRIRLVIVQPSDRGETLRTAEVGVLELFDFVNRLRWAVDNGHRDELLNSGDHCRFCPVRPVCPKLQQLATRALGHWQDPHRLTGAQVGEALTVADQLETWIRSIREYAHDKLSNGHEVDGWKLVPRQARRKWIDEAKVREWALHNRDLDKGKAFETKLRSPAQLEKLTEVPESLYESRSSGTTLAPVSDPREAVQTVDPMKQMQALADQAAALNMLGNRKPIE